MVFKHFIQTLLFLFVAACTEQLEYESGADDAGFTPATPGTQAVNEKLIKSLPFENQQDFVDARRGLIAKPDKLVIAGYNNVAKVWDMPAYDFIQYQPETANAPASVNPSLWRQAALNNIHGLFRVTEGVYQVRGFDLANMTIIEGESGWIIIDPLTAAETAESALLFAQSHLGIKPIKAILFTHSHIDHFGGVQGILKHIPEGQKKSLRVIAPKGFIEEATSENIIAGTAMSRRAMFMYGQRLPRSVRGHIGSGLGKGPAFGSFGLIPATEVISDTPTALDIDGVPFIFQYTPESEAPAEFTFYLPKQRAFCGAELVSRNMHNLYTLRGAKVRDALAWSAYIEQASQDFSEADVYFGSHHWPLWGRQNIQSFLSKQSDTYKYIHDQTVRLMNQGYTPNEIAEQIKLPKALEENFSTRGYYGTLKHNSKAVYQAYMGWFNGNPATLDPLPESEAASRYIEMMGGAQIVLDKASQRFDKVNEVSTADVNKEYRWLAQLLNQLVFAEPKNQAAKSLLAKVYDQLAYQSESAPWRDFYLTGAFELRNGPPLQGIDPAIMKDVLIYTPVEKFFDSMAVNLNGPAAEGEHLSVRINFTDLEKSYLLALDNSVLRYEQLGQEKAASNTVLADATLNLTHPLFVNIVVGEAGLTQSLLGEDLSIEGSRLDLLSFFSLIDKPKGVFNIVVP
jgi:alkyl sulfatase BDS1-like metallo-beta-lactamase superfamily hydrolase